MRRILRRSLYAAVVLLAISTVFVSSYASRSQRNRVARGQESKRDAVHLPGIPPRGPETLFYPQRDNAATPSAIDSVITLLNNGGNGYAGVDFTHSGGGLPPDTCGAAGPSSYVETTNQEIALYSPKGTGATASLDGLADFFFTVGGLPHGFSDIEDPTMIYDELNGRFIVGEQDYGNGFSNFLLAVSKTSNPTTLTTADWVFYYISTAETGYFADFPGNLGYNADALVITLNMFPNPNGSPHVLVTSVNASDLATGVAQASLRLFQNDVADFSLRPAAMHDAVAGGPMWLVGEHGDNKTMEVIKMTNVLSSAPTFTFADLAVNAYARPASPLNPNGTVITSHIDSRILKAAVANNTLVATQIVGVSRTQDAARWYIVDVAGATPILSDQGEIVAGDNTYLIYPAIDINSAGTVGLTYMRSGTDTTTDYMSMYVTGRRSGDAAGTMQTPILVGAGTGQANYADFGGTSSRAGDISGINVDPSDGTFWAANEWATTASGSQADANWGTAIANFSIIAAINVSVIQKSANSITVTFGPVVRGVSYRLEREDTLDPNGWAAINGVPDFTASTNAASAPIADPNGGAASEHFYRVRVLP